MKISIKTDTRRHGKTMPVCICVTQQGKTSYIATDLRTSTPFKGLVFPKNEFNYAKKTARLAELFSACESWALHNPEATHEQTKDAIRNIINPSRKDRYNLVYYCNQYAETLKSPSTAAFYTRTARHIGEFAPSATFEDVDVDFLVRLDKWLMETKGHKTNGRGIVLRCLRAVFNRAIDNGITDRYPFRKFKVKQEQTEHRVLTDEELVQLRDYPLQDDWREMYRDLFMLSLYLCGINATDLLHLTPSAIRNGRLKYARKKTNHKFNMVVPTQAQEIIDRYRGKKYLLSPLEKYDKFADFLKHWNNGLKKVGRFSLVEDKTGHLRKFRYDPVVPTGITTYWSRHTWATIAAKIGINRDTIAQCLGHSWANVTDIYIAPDTTITDNAILAVADYVSNMKT